MGTAKPGARAAKPARPRAKPRRPRKPSAAALRKERDAAARAILAEARRLPLAQQCATLLPATELADDDELRDDLRTQLAIVANDALADSRWDACAAAYAAAAGLMRDRDLDEPERANA